MDETRLVLIILGVVGGVVALVMASILCSCCWKRKNDDDDDDTQRVTGKYSAVNLDDVSSLHDLGSQRSGSIDSRGSLMQQRAKSPAIGKKSIKPTFRLFNGLLGRFERPEKRVVAEPVQPSSPITAQTSLNQSVGNHRDLYQATGESQALRTTDSTKDTSLWKDVQKFTQKFLEEGATPEEPVVEDTAEGIDYKLGKIQFCVGYDFPTSTLTVRVYRATDLPAKDFSGTSDPYVKVMLLPDKKHKFTTKIKKRNLNPRWNETFAYEGETRRITVINVLSADDWQIDYCCY